MLCMCSLKLNRIIVKRIQHVHFIYYAEHHKEMYGFPYAFSSNQDSCHCEYKYRDHKRNLVRVESKVYHFLERGDDEKRSAKIQLDCTITGESRKELLHNTFHHHHHHLPSSHPPQCV